MDLTTILNSGPVFALIGVLITVFFNFIIQRSKGSASVQMTERKTLSEDQEKFKQSILQELTDCREAVDKLVKDNVSWREKAIQVQEQKLALTEEIIHLNQKVIQLEAKIAELNAVIEEIKKGSN